MATKNVRGRNRGNAEIVVDDVAQPVVGLGQVTVRNRVRDVEVQESTNFRSDRVRWGPIWGGLLTTLTVFLLLSLLGLAIGLTSVPTGTAAAGAISGDTGRHSALWLAASGIISFLIGGYLAGKTAAVFDRTWGALNGAMIFFLAVPLIVWMASVGAGANLGGLGNSIRHNLGLVQSATTTSDARNAAWGTLIALVVALLASAIGGYLGTRRPEVNRPNRHRV